MDSAEVKPPGELAKIRVVEGVAVTLPLDPYLSLKALASYSGLSVRKLREALTDPSYRGQILVLTYPLIGNYGVSGKHSVNGLEPAFESDRIQIARLIISEVSRAQI